MLVVWNGVYRKIEEVDVNLNMFRDTSISKKDYKVMQTKS